MPARCRLLASKEDPVPSGRVLSEERPLPVFDTSRSHQLTWMSGFGGTPSPLSGLRRSVKSSGMFFTHGTELKALRVTTSTLERRIQQISAELAELRTRVPTLDDPNLVARLAVRVSRAQAKSERELDRFLLEIHSAAETATSLRVKQDRRGRAGGLARSRNAWRYSDGTFMAESERQEIYREEYERHAAGGRARAATASRAEDGTFLP
jgi:hypothetical protein